MSDATPFFGPLFPDFASAPIATPATPATLALSGVTSSGVLDGLTARARVLGVAGNSYQLKLECDAVDDSDVLVDEAAGDVIVHVKDTATTVGDFVALVNTDSAFIEIVGTYNPSDIIDFSDAFISTPLAGGAAALSTLCRFWGPHFPDGPDADPPRVDPTSPPSAATFVLALENGVHLTLSWSTDVFKAYDGTERRASLLDDPRQSYTGRALLLGDAVRQVRAQLGRYAALGRPFLLGLPYEETTLSEDATGLVYPVESTADLDWAVVGQRVLVVGGDGNGFDATIQEVAADSITLDIGPGTIGVEGARIMPGMPVLFDPQQGFRRKRTAAGADFWEIQGRASLYGFPSSAVPGELQLGPITESGFENVFLRARVPGDQTVEVRLSASLDPGITIDESFNSVDGSGELDITVEDSVSTMADLAAAINGQSQLVFMLGTWNDTDIAASAGTNEFLNTPLTGGVAAAPGEMGRGATVVVFEGTGGSDDRLIWDRGIANHDVIGDSMQSMTETVDLGGIPFSVGQAEVPDWGRQVGIESDEFSEWQWLKAFLSAVRGRWKSWLLPTGRADLVSSADAAATTLTIEAGIGDYDLWASRGYDVLRVEQDAGVRYVRVTSAVTSGDDLILTVEGDALDAAPVSLLSWCELCRFESDDIEIVFGADGFSMTAQARVIQNGADE